MFNFCAHSLRKPVVLSNGFQLTRMCSDVLIREFSERAAFVMTRAFSWVSGVQAVLVPMLELLNHCDEAHFKYHVGDPGVALVCEF